MKLFTHSTAVTIAAFLAYQPAWATFYPELFGSAFGGVAYADQEILAGHEDFELAASLSGCPVACDLLEAARPELLHYPGTPSYIKAKNGFWSMTQRDMVPHCIYQPRLAADVALAVIVSKHTRCPFSVKSGGHGKFAGESIIDGGLSIDLAHLNQVKVIDNGQSVLIGPGNRWVDVYTSLEPLGIIVAGGRDASVGVGGFLQGGGISFHSSEHGWGSDNIKSFEVVLANGTIATASPTLNPDLYKALRGTGSNFGIVTAFTMEAIPYRGIWGGMVTTAFSETPALMQAFMNYGRNSLKYPKASVILNFGPDFADGSTWIWYSDIQYTEPEANPEALREIMAVPSISDETVISNLSTQTQGLARFTVPGRRYAFWVLSTKFDERLFRFFVDTWVADFDKIRPTMRNFRPTFNIQVITAGMRRAMRKHGGNSLGLDDSEEPLLLFNPTPKWMEIEHDSLIASTVHSILKKVKAEAKRLKQESNFLYMNYASEYQDPISSYGPKMRSFLDKVANKYDPHRVFQRLQPGSYKLDGLPGFRDVSKVDQMLRYDIAGDAEKA